MSRFGLIHTIWADIGTSFVSAEFKEFCFINRIELITTPTYNPSSNGQAESSVKIVKKAIKSIILSGNTINNINVKLCEFLFRYRNTAHSTTDRSPAEVLFGHKLRCRLDTLNTHHPPARDASLDVVVKQKQCLQSKYYSGNRSVEFANNEIVLIKIYKRQKTFWQKGLVVKKIGNSVYLVRLLDSEPSEIFKRHTNQLLKYKGEEEHQELYDQNSNQQIFEHTSSDADLPPIIMEAEQDAPLASYSIPEENTMQPPDESVGVDDTTELEDGTEESSPPPAPWSNLRNIFIYRP